VRGREVAVLGGEVLLVREVGGLAHEQVCMLGEGEGAVAEPGVHHEGEALARPDLAHLFEADGAISDGVGALPDQSSDLGPADSEGLQPLGQHVPPWGLFEPVSEGLAAVIERAGDEPKGGSVDPGPGGIEGMDEEVCGVVEHGGMSEPLEVTKASGREVHVHRMGRTVEGEALDDAGKPETVVAVEVGDADHRDGRDGDAGPGQLALGPFAGVEKDAVFVPAQEVPVRVPSPRRHLAGGPEHDELSHYRPPIAG
jgi:hypothetical protein